MRSCVHSVNDADSVDGADRFHRTAGTCASAAVSLQAFMIQPRRILTGAGVSGGRKGNPLGAALLTRGATNALRTTTGGLLLYSAYCRWHGQPVDAPRSTQAVFLFRFGGHPLLNAKHSILNATYHWQQLHNGA